MSIEVEVRSTAMVPNGVSASSPAGLASTVAESALGGASLSARDLDLIVVSNALGGDLYHQPSVRGQSWLRHINPGGTPIVNVDNSCGGGSAAIYMGLQAVKGGAEAVMVVGVEKMNCGDSRRTISAIEGGVEAEDRLRRRSQSSSGATILTTMAAQWAAQQIEDRGASTDDFAVVAEKAYLCGSRNPYASRRVPFSRRDVARSRPVAGVLRRLMCSSIVDGAAAIILTPAQSRSAITIVGSAAVSGTGDGDYHSRLSACARSLWESTNADPRDVGLFELHDVTSAEELWAMESVGICRPGEAADLAANGETGPEGQLRVNPGGGLVARGHPIGATGVCQVADVARVLREDRELRPRLSRLAAVFNSGGVIGPDVAWIGGLLVNNG